MKIIIEPEDEDFERFEIEKVYQFALTGNYMNKGFMPQSFNRTHGGIAELVGKLKELEVILLTYKEEEHAVRTKAN